MLKPIIMKKTILFSIAFLIAVVSYAQDKRDLKLNKDKEIEDLSFEGEGCAISLASASILTEIIKGKDLSFLKKINDDFLNMIKNKTKITINSLSDDQITTITSLSGVQEFPMRVKCATMAWHTCLSAVNKK